MAKKPSVFVNKELGLFYGRMAKASAKKALYYAEEGNAWRAEARNMVREVEYYAELAGGNVMRDVVLA